MSPLHHVLHLGEAKGFDPQEAKLCRLPSLMNSIRWHLEHPPKDLLMYSMSCRKLCFICGS